ncbi:hypothetical protein OAI_00945 [Vibrio cyclitrophicus FF160]|uniref:hypothetical protein n=1 Tax=Vibrio cyclitrophicus TaxID=47951 RepID=UPI000376BB15|nr:hypothetical protein [Vibrio cyclitrophicus]OEE82855.1 hypothetical protein OAI_00945 [Vibrio cyclitrophicus FF160]
MNNSSELTQAIDNDEGLQSKRKLLTVASLTLLALSFSGATIDEANTFIFKIKFANQNGLGILLVLSIIFLMVRYYNYAKPYHDKLYLIWTQRLLSHPFFFLQNPHEPEDSIGIVAESRCSELDANINHDIQRWDYYYQCGVPFTRYIVHYWGYNEHSDEDRMDKVNILKRFGVALYFKTLYFEVIEQFRSFFTHRENLDILAPYMLGSLAIASYYFNAELMELLLFFTPSKNN